MVQTALSGGTLSAAASLSAAVGSGFFSVIAFSIGDSINLFAAFVNPPAVGLQQFCQQLLRRVHDVRRAALCQRLNRLRVHVKDVKLVTLFQQILRHWRAHLP